MLVGRKEQPLEPGEALYHLLSWDIMITRVQARRVGKNPEAVITDDDGRPAKFRRAHAFRVPLRTLPPRNAKKAVFYGEQWAEQIVDHDSSENHDEEF